MKRRELLEWLSLTRADLPGWLALLCVAAMYYFRSFALDLVLTALAVSLAMLSFHLGRQPDPELSRANNLAKKWLYPIFLVIVILAIVFHFAIWKNVMEQRAGIRNQESTVSGQE